MRFRHRAVALVVGLLLSVGLGGCAAATHSTASHHASIGRYLGTVDPDEWCDVAQVSTCMNARNGGPILQDWYSNVANNSFGLYSVNRCNGGLSSTNCPISGNPVGWTIAQFQDPTLGTCVDDANGNSGSANAYVNGTCNGSNGYGGDYGTVFLLYHDPGCPVGFDLYYNAHWSPSWTSRRGLSWNTPGVGNQAYLNVNGILCLQEQVFNIAAPLAPQSPAPGATTGSPAATVP